MKKSIIISFAFFILLTLPGFSQKRMYVTTEDFCTFFGRVFSFCDTGFKAIKTNLIDSEETSVGFHRLYGTNYEWPDAIIASISSDEEMGYISNIYSATICATNNVAVFKATYTKYKKILNGCTSVRFSREDSVYSANKIVKGFPDLIYISKDVKVAEGEAEPNSINLVCKTDENNFEIEIKVNAKLIQD
jgi:hypothetical protein